MRIPLLAGREFNERDRTGTPPVAIVNEAWAKVNLDGANPVGQSAIDFGIARERSGAPAVGNRRGVEKHQVQITVSKGVKMILTMPCVHSTPLLTPPIKKGHDGKTAPGSPDGLIRALFIRGVRRGAPTLYDLNSRISG
jgi:hypothetical protein